MRLTISVVKSWADDACALMTDSLIKPPKIVTTTRKKPDDRQCFLTSLEPLCLAQSFALQHAIAVILILNTASECATVGARSY
jgi:hypothetical protein